MAKKNLPKWGKNFSFSTFLQIFNELSTKIYLINNNENNNQKYKIIILVTTIKSDKYRQISSFLLNISH